MVNSSVNQYQLKKITKGTQNSLSTKFFTRTTFDRNPQTINSKKLKMTETILNLSSNAEVVEATGSIADKRFVKGADDKIIKTKLLAKVI